MGLSIFAASPIVTLTLNEKKALNSPICCTLKGEEGKGGEECSFCTGMKGSSMCGLLLQFPQPWIPLCFVLQKCEAC